MTSFFRQSAEALLFLVEVIERFFDDESPKLAAALAYYAIFSIPPLLIILLTSVQVLFAEEQLDAVLRPLTSTLPSDRVASEVLALSERARQWAQSGPRWSVVLSVGGVLFAATRGLAELHATLNRIWGVTPGPDRGLARVFVMKRFFALLMLGGLSLMLVLSIVLNTAFQLWGTPLLARVPFLRLFAPLEGAVSIVLVTLLLAAIYRLLPDAKITTRQVLPGALFTAVLFQLAKQAFSRFVAQMELGELFGQASSLMALLVWLYMCGLLVALGAEFTQVWTLRTAGGVDPDEGNRKEPARTLVVTPRVRDTLENWIRRLGDGAGPRE